MPARSLRAGGKALSLSLSSSDEEIASTGSSTKWDQNPVFELPSHRTFLLRERERSALLNDASV